MRTPAAFISGMATMGVLATGVAWGAGIANGSTDQSAQGNSDPTSTNTANTDTTNSNTGTQTDTAHNPTGAKDGTYDGDVVQTRYGPMQIEVVITNGKIASAVALQQPDGDRTSRQINEQVIPMLNDAIVQYQTLDFGNVSRATFSTNGYKESAQSALDKAGFTG
ncbi:MAG: FMN-binding protein [Microbacteriaceae bacterium]